MNNIDITVVVPVFNEELIIQELYLRTEQSLCKISDNFEIIFINDGSNDKSLDIIISLSESDKRVKYISFSRNFGHQIAVTAGLNNCKGDVVVVIDGDLQDPPELIPSLYKKYKEGYDVVYAKRIGDTILKKFTAKIFYRLLKRITTIDIPLDTGDFRLIGKNIVENLKLMPEQSKFLRGQIAWLGFRQTFVEFERDERKAGKTGYTFKKMINLALDGITAFSDSPLKFVTKIGIIFSFIALLIIMYALYSYFILNKVISGWTSLIISSMFFGGVQLVSIGIIGEYISRINKDVRCRPLYIVDKSNI